ncbi:uncharacterized protein LOC124166862 [Ischnura elegans]|uniref:uncharacterized protein LOC124166862 n=1 Tax=Ischnura elegans TaxID=197161 RepID=UPI001ED89913|nr:uncharacterized protein LOC124166862 [Ischnura elegans]
MRIDIKTIIAVLTLAASVRTPPASAISNDFDTLFHHHHQHHHRQTQQVHIRHHNGGSNDREFLVESSFDDGEETLDPSDFPETTTRSMQDPLIRPPRHSFGFRGDHEDRFDWDKDVLLSDAAIDDEPEDMAALGFDGGGGRPVHMRAGDREVGVGGGPLRKSRERGSEVRRNLDPLECCPSVTEMVEPDGGKNSEGMYVELYTVDNKRQRFIDVSCKEGVEGTPCRFLNKRHHNQSRCIQKTSFSYALVKSDPNRTSESERHQQRYHRIHGVYFPAFPLVSGPGWTLDYIEVRSGCSCEVTHPDNGRRRGKGGGGKGRKKGVKKKVQD